MNRMQMYKLLMILTTLITLTVGMTASGLSSPSGFYDQQIDNRDFDDSTSTGWYTSYYTSSIFDYYDDDAEDESVVRFSANNYQSIIAEYDDIDASIADDRYVTASIYVKAPANTDVRMYLEAVEPSCTYMYPIGQVCDGTTTNTEYSDWLQIDSINDGYQLLSITDWIEGGDSSTEPQSITIGIEAQDNDYTALIYVDEINFGLSNDKTSTHQQDGTVTFQLDSGISVYEMGDDEGSNDLDRALISVSALAQEFNTYNTGYDTYTESLEIRVYKPSSTENMITLNTPVATTEEGDSELNPNAEVAPTVPHLDTATLFLSYGGLVYAPLGYTAIALSTGAHLYQDAYETIDSYVGTSSSDGRSANVLWDAFTDTDQILGNSYIIYEYEGSDSSNDQLIIEIEANLHKYYQNPLNGYETDEEIVSLTQTYTVDVAN